MSVYSETINLLADRFGFNNYLEIGVQRGNTFLYVKMPNKTAVDPHFIFNFKEHGGENIKYFENTSDDFFINFQSCLSEKQYQLSNNKKFTFDIIFIDGLHTFEQCYKDFVNSLNYSHARSIWIFDDTIPSDPWSTIQNQQKCYTYRKMAGIFDIKWTGDVFKTIFAIHDLHSDFSYATVIDKPVPYTIVWRAQAPAARRPIYGNLDAIAAMSYFDLLDNAFIMLPEEETVAVDLISAVLNPEDYRSGTEAEKIVKKISIS